MKTPPKQRRPGRSGFVAAGAAAAGGWLGAVEVLLRLKGLNAADEWLIAVQDL